MENPSSWSIAATIINEAVQEWYNKDAYHWSSLGVYVEAKLNEAGLLNPTTSQTDSLLKPRPQNE
jgi:hypothetical protein